MADDYFVIDDRQSSDMTATLGSSWRLITDGVMGGLSSGIEVSYESIRHLMRSIRAGICPQARKQRGSPGDTLMKYSPRFMVSMFT